MSKTFKNTTGSQAEQNVRDIKFWGDKDIWKLISKAHSDEEEWMKSTKAMQIDGLGCLVQVTTQQYGNVAKAVTFVPGVQIKENLIDSKVVARKLVKF